MLKRLLVFSCVVIAGLSMTSCDSTTASSESSTNESNNASPRAERVGTGDLKFAYVNTDSLSTKYDMIKELEEQMLQERIQMENQLQGMVRDLEKDYTDAQQGAAGLSDEALAILQQKLAQKEQQVMQQKNAMEGQLMRSEQEKTDAYLEKVQTFLNTYAKAEGYDIIYGYNGLNNVLYIDATYDVTDVIVDSLNSTYAAEKLQAQK